jgi:SAM-dependent methyltransferase
MAGALKMAEASGENLLVLPRNFQEKHGNHESIFIDYLPSLVGYKVKLGDRILDFGCGIGDSVAALLVRGFDAYGCDILELWGNDREKYWAITDDMPSHVTERLSQLDLAAYRLPYPDGHFDYCLSSETFEHVANYESALREIARVLKAGAPSFHVFPGPFCPTDGHIDVPFIPLCRYRAWLTVWALLGRRNPRAPQLSWRDTVELDIEFLENCFYPTERQILADAKSCGVQVSFFQRIAFPLPGSRAENLIRWFERLGIGTPTRYVLSHFCHRVMIIWGRGH